MADRSAGQPGAPEAAGTMVSVGEVPVRASRPEHQSCLCRLQGSRGVGKGLVGGEMVKVRKKTTF